MPSQKARIAIFEENGIKTFLHFKRMSLYETVDYGLESYGDWTDPWRQVISVDPASKKNLALRVERRYPDGKIETILFQLFDMTLSMNQQIDPLAPKEKKKRRTKEEIAAEAAAKEAKKKEVPEYPWSTVNTWIDSIWDKLKDSHYFIIERQLPINYRAVRVQQHLLSYLMARFRLDVSLRHRCRFYEVNPKLKGSVLGAPKCKEKELKEWAVDKSLEILEARGDQESLTYVRALKKKDDAADTVCHLEAFAQVYPNFFGENPGQVAAAEQPVEEKPRKKRAVKPKVSAIERMIAKAPSKTETEVPVKGTEAPVKETEVETPVTEAPVKKTRSKKKTSDQ